MEKQECRILQAPSATGTKYYYRKTTVTYSGYTCVASSTIATIAVSDLSAGSIGGTQTICLGEVPTTLTSVADATGNTVSYQWQQSIDDGATWTNLSGSGSATNAFTPAATITQTTQFKRNATSVSCGTSASSNVVYVYVNRFPNSSLAITFNDNSNTPVDICPGADPFPLKDNSTLTGDGDITYLWQKSTDNGTSWSSATGTNNQVTYDPPTVSVDIWYRRQTTSTLNTDTCVDYTNTLKFIAGNNADPGSVKTTNPDTGNDNLEVICSGDIPKPNHSKSCGLCNQRNPYLSVVYLYLQSVLHGSLLEELPQTLIRLLLLHRPLIICGR